MITRTIFAPTALQSVRLRISRSRGVLASMPSPSSTPEEGAEFHSNTGDTPVPQSSNPIADAEDEQKLRDLFSELFTELHQRARWSMAQVGQAHTLQATALIGEAYMRLQKSDNREWDSKEHFLLTAAKVMRSVLLDHHRKKRALKRDLERVDLAVDDIAQDFENRGIDLERLDLALERLEKEQPIMAQAIQLRFFAGVEVEEIATILNLSKRTLERRMQTVRAWLRVQI